MFFLFYIFNFTRTKKSNTETEYYEDDLNKDIKSDDRIHSYNSVEENSMFQKYKELFKKQMSFTGIIYRYIYILFIYLYDKY